MGPGNSVAIHGIGLRSGAACHSHIRCRPAVHDGRQGEPSSAWKHRRGSPSGYATSWPIRVPSFPSGDSPAHPWWSTTWLSSSPAGRVERASSAMTVPPVSIAWTAGEGRMSYSSPHLAPGPDGDQVLMLTELGMEVYEPQTGQRGVAVRLEGAGYAHHPTGVDRRAATDHWRRL